MPISLDQALRDWRDFYILAGTAAATLVGLMFVSASIGASQFTLKDLAADAGLHHPDGRPFRRSPVRLPGVDHAGA